MFCPNCGNQATGDQKFCRSCGMDLRKVAPALAEHHGEIGDSKYEIRCGRNIYRGPLQKVLWGVMLLFAGIAVSIIGRMFMHDDQVRGAGALISIFGTFLAVYFALSAVYKIASTERHSTRQARVSEVSEAKTTAQLPLEKFPVLIPSVTERTTDSLANASIRSPEGRRSGELSV